MARIPFSRGFPGFLLLAGAMSGVTGCRDDGIASYRIPKEPETASAPAQPAAAPSRGPTLRWSVPAGWLQQPASGMRQASFLVAGPDKSAADVSVVSFPGAGGDDLANINRWRNQLKLSPVSDAELPGQTRSFATAAGTFVVADLAGTAADGRPARILGAWLRRPDKVWFFKMMGSSGLVEAQKDVFLAFLKSVGPTVAPAEDALAAQPPTSLFNTNDLPVASPGASLPPAAPGPGAGGMDSVQVQAESGASLLWTAPAGWQSQPGHPMRRGSYAAGGGAEVAITAFPGDVGGVLANVNRWRAQAGLAPVDDAGLAQAASPLDSNGLHILVVDATGGSSPIVAALVPWNGGTWFFKLTGPAAAVAKAKPDFLSFLATVRTP